MRVVAIDMCTVFKAAVRDSLPDAILVVDRFHVATRVAPAAATLNHAAGQQPEARLSSKSPNEFSSPPTFAIVCRMFVTSRA